MLIVTFLAAIGTAIMAGIFFTFSVFAMTAFGRLPPEQGIAAMQSINETIQNPLFFAVFFGTALASLILIAGCFLSAAAPRPGWLLAGAGLYLATCMVVTIVWNVPMNNALAAVTPGTPESLAVWTDYLTRWTAWNHVRTAGCIASLAAFIQALR